MPSLIFRGRPAWIAGMIFGLILVIVGFSVSSARWVGAVGGAFFVFGLVIAMALSRMALLASTSARA